MPLIYCKETGVTYVDQLYQVTIPIKTKVTYRPICDLAVVEREAKAVPLDVPLSCVGDHLSFFLLEAELALLRALREHTCRNRRHVPVVESQVSRLLCYDLTNMYPTRRTRDLHFHCEYCENPTVSI